MPDSMEAVFVALVTVMPGFVANAVWSRDRIGRPAESDLRVVLQSLTFSALLQVLLAPFTISLVYPVRGELFEHPWRLVVWGLVTLLIAPSVFGLLVGRLTDLIFPRGPAVLAADGAGWRRVLWAITRRPTAPSAWDHACAAQLFDGRFVVVQFKDGRRVAGAFGIGSAASTAPQQPGLVLAREWVLDGDGDLFAEVPYSRGLVIPNLDEVSWIRIQEGEPDPT